MSPRHTARSHAARLFLATALLALGVQPFAHAQDASEPVAADEAGIATLAPAEETITPKDPSASEAPDPQSPSPGQSDAVDPTPPAQPAPVEEIDATEEADAPQATASTTADKPALQPSPSAKLAEANTPGAARLASPGCPASDRTDSITGVTVAPVVVSPSDIVTVTFSAVMREGGCDGDFIDLVLPSQLAGLTGTFPITSPDGSVIASMVVTNGRALITFNDYLEFNTNVSFQGNLKARVRVSVEPDTRYDLEWQAGDQIFVTPITTAPCPGCGPANVRTRKFAEYEAGPPPFVRFAISALATQTANEVLVFTDTVDSGHEIDCAAITVRMGTTLDAWGSVQFTQNWTNYTVQSCSATTMAVRVQATAIGQYFRVLGQSTPTVLQPEYSDSATVTQAGVTNRVRASARLTDGGGQVDGTRRAPRVTIEKWSTVDGPKAGDFDNEYKNLKPDKNEQITFTVTNNGNEILNNIVVTDRTTAGTGTIRRLTCDFSALGGPSSGTTWAGPFDIDDSFTCKGRLPALGKNAKHTDRAKVVAVGRATTNTVTDTDEWNGTTRKSGNPPPGVDIEKWSTEDGPRDGDFDNQSKALQFGETTGLTFTITNRGKEPIVDIRVRDRVVAGSASVDGLTCDFSALGGPATGTRWEGPLKIGKSFRCEATLGALAEGVQHTDRATVSATGQNSGTTTTDTDRWNGKVFVGALPEVGLNSRIAPTAGIGILLALVGFWLLRRNRQPN